jgi:hypothetical protein
MLLEVWGGSPEKNAKAKDKKMIKSERRASA